MSRASAESRQLHLSGEDLDLLLIGGLSQRDAEAAHGHLEGCATCRARWGELSEDKRRFEEHVFRRTMPRVEAEVARRRVALKVAVFTLGGLLVAAAVALLRARGGW